MCFSCMHAYVPYVGLVPKESEEMSDPWELKL